ncbi:MAG: AtpZ/AtpI family protein [Rickettsiaceae bacterium]
MTSDNQIKDLQDKIVQFKDRKSDKKEQIVSNSGLFIIATELVSYIITGLILGFLLDKMFATRPLFMIICVLIAFIANIKVTIKTYKK